LQWLDCEVTKDDDGRPVFELTGTVAARTTALGARTLHLSMSHDAGLASAMVVAEA
jgi:holo-[acyl-carrier protein] synthase